MDTTACIKRCEELLPNLPPDQRIYLDVTIREAHIMQVIRQLCAGVIDVDEASEDD